MEPFLVSENAMGFTAVRYHYSADPEKDPNNPNEEMAERARAWLAAQKNAYPDPNDFEREFEINFNVGKGSRVFPQFSELYHCRPLTFNTRRVVYRAWDFGWWAPVCLFAQIDREGRLVLVKEIVGAKKTTHDFAQDVIRRGAEWLPLFAAGFEDFCDPAGQQVKSVENERNERRDVDVLTGLQIHPKYEYGWSRKDGRSLVHQTLRLRADGTPSFLVDPAGCPLTTQAFLGRYVFPETRDGKIREEPDDDTHPWADVMAAVRYLVTGLHKRLGLSRFQLGQQVPRAAAVADRAFTGYGTPTR